MTSAGAEVSFAGAEADVEIAGLIQWTAAATHRGDFWTAPAGTTATLDVVGGGTDDDLAPELQWSTRAAEIPSTRGLAFFDGPGFGSVTSDFECAHEIAEDVAEFVAARSGDEVGPIEVLCFRPEEWPRPTVTATGVEFDFLHRGGARVHLTLTVPPAESEA